ncbi:MAG: thioredoxin domain-containing protein [Rhizobiales bacterium]|nr:thioredoxin domain-containing protein [Hyphomicrobiales bacterium]
MTRLKFSRLVLGAIALPLTLGLAACGGSEDAGAQGNRDPIETVAPPEGKAWTEIVAKTPEGGYRMGNPEAPIKLVEYGSLTCPHCAQFAADSSEEIRGTFVESGRVSFEFRNFVMNPLDLTMAMLTRCGTPESYFALTEQVFANQNTVIETWSGLDEAALNNAANQPPATRYQAMAQLAGLPDFFASRGISKDQAMTCLADGASAESLVQSTQQQSEEFDITGTPSFLVNGVKLDSNAWPEIKTRLENMGAR